MNKEQEFVTDWQGLPPAGILGKAEETVIREDGGIDRLRHEFYPPGSGTKGSLHEGITGLELKVTIIIARHKGSNPQTPNLDKKDMAAQDDDTHSQILTPDNITSFIQILRR